MNPWPAALAVLVLVIPQDAARKPPVQPTSKDKCPVCGMFVAPYPDFLAEAIFRDGSVVFFDGPKDLFKFLFGLKTYAPARTRSEVDAIYVTEYYGLSLVDAEAAFFVLGGDVLGPMGRELIPLKTRAEAEQFVKDHAGRTILTFKDIGPATLKELD